MDNEYWLERWKKKEIGFHQESFNEYLLQYGEVLLKNSKNVFIPLCGKTKDILWFHQYHYHILGVELSEIACKEFFEENSIPYSIQQKEYFKIFTSFDKKIYIINGDFFSLTEDFINSFFLIDSIYDRASLVAFPYTKRKEYVKKIHELFHKIKIKYVLICLEFEPIEKSIQEIGPPFSVKETEIHKLYYFFKIQKITEKNIERKNAKNSKEILYYMENSV